MKIHQKERHTKNLKQHHHYIIKANKNDDQKQQSQRKYNDGFQDKTKNKEMKT